MRTLGQAVAAGTVVTLVVARLDTGGRLPGADVQAFAIFGSAEAPTGLQPFFSGVTDAGGEVTVEVPVLSGPQNEPPALYRFVVTAPEAQAGAGPLFSRTVDVPFGAGEVEEFVGWCPPASDPVVCEVSDKQLRMAEQLALLNSQWGGQSDFTVDQAHAYLESLPVSDARLKASWIGDLSWGLMDVAIPPGGWPALLERRARTMKLLLEPPWPEIGGKDWFFR